MLCTPVLDTHAVHTCRTAKVCPVPIGQRVYCDAGISLEVGQSLLGEAFALLTMSVYLSWIHILLMLMVAALFSKTALWVCIGKAVAERGQHLRQGWPCN